MDQPKKWENIAMVHANLNGIVGEELKQISVQFENPLKSFDVNVMCTNDDNNFMPRELYSSTQILCKLVAIPSIRKTVFVPIHHTLPKNKLKQVTL